MSDKVFGSTHQSFTFQTFLLCLTIELSAFSIKIQGIRGRISKERGTVFCEAVTQGVERIFRDTCVEVGGGSLGGCLVLRFVREVFV